MELTMYVAGAIVRLDYPLLDKIAEFASLKVYFLSNI